MIRGEMLHLHHGQDGYAFDEKIKEVRPVGCVVRTRGSSADGRRGQPLRVTIPVPIHLSGAMLEAPIACARRTLRALQPGALQLIKDRFRIPGFTELPA
jgi:hypothetical protein